MLIVTSQVVEEISVLGEDHRLPSSQWQLSPMPLLGFETMQR